MDRLEKYALKNNIPIMQKEGILFLKEYIKENNIKNILEIGSAIGYSAINMIIDKSIKIITVEKDKNRYQEALKNIELFKLNKQISIINADALEIEINDKFDLIFIDAAKAQYIKLFEKYKKNLTENGTIISDNLDFHGLTNSSKIESRNLRALVRKINNYKEFLRDNKEFETKFLKIGDGVGVTKRK